MIVKGKRRKIAWGITGSGEKIMETVEIMEKMKKKYRKIYDIRVFISKAGDQVLKYYNLSNTLETIFDKTWTEINANAPFLAGQIQLGSYEFLLVAPCNFQHSSKDIIKDSRHITYKCGYYGSENIYTNLYYANRL